MYQESFFDWATTMSEYSNPPFVVSVSYTQAEASVSSSDMSMFDTEMIKLGLQGVTVLFAAGDGGVSGTDSTVCGYSPEFPASCPYVTAVGATQNYPEISCSSATWGTITSGGGFSNIYEMPSWQTEAVSNYFTQVSVQPEAGYASGGRAYPDIALLGANYYPIIGGDAVGLSGTSASTPVFAALMALINSGRIAAGKPTIGWLNPLLYQLNGSITRDIVVGNNSCLEYNEGTPTDCCKEGFLTAPGWDPVTGWGSVGDFRIFYAEMLKVNVTSAPTAFPTLAPNSTKSNGLSDGEIAGITIGSVTGFVLLVGIVWLVISKCCKKAATESSNAGAATNPMADRL
jgi:tripeptidyl-peptidase-1